VEFQGSINIKVNLNAVVKYYLRHGIMTDPGEYAHLYEGLPDTVPELVEVVQGLLIHVFHAHRYGVQLSEDRQKQDLSIRRVEDMLARIRELDDRPLVHERDFDNRMVGNCRDFSVLMLSMLRHKGISARARCGFGTYFTPDKYEDHWVCEYWNPTENRFVRVDAQLDEVQKRALNIDFDTLAVPPGTFLPAGRVMQLCRKGIVRPDQCGILNMWGLWFVRDNVLRDLMAMNKLELMPWDCNDFMRKKDRTPEDEDLVDEVADVTTAGDGFFPHMRELYRSHPELGMPKDWKP
jgi:hypothetical protein